MMDAINLGFKLLTVISLIVGILGPSGAIVAMIFVPTVALPIIKKIVEKLLDCTICIVVIAVIVSSLSSYWIGRWGQYKRGESDAIAGIAREDAKLIDRARAGRAKYEECVARGMRWSQVTGDCR